MLRVGHRRALSYINIAPDTYGKAVQSTDWGRWGVLKCGGCSCQSVQLLCVHSGARANNRLSIFYCYSCNLIASTFVEPVGVCHKSWLIEQLILESFPLKYCQGQQGIVPMYTCHGSYLFCHFYLPQYSCKHARHSGLLLCNAFFPQNTGFGDPRSVLCWWNREKCLTLKEMIGKLECPYKLFFQFRTVCGTG